MTAAGARYDGGMSKPITDLIHHPYVPPAGFAAPQPGVYKASTVIFPNVAAMRARDWKHKTGYTYGLHGTPTTFMLEERIAALEGGKHCLLVPSGLAAIANVDLALLKSGDEVLIPDNAYGPTKALAEGELKNWGITPPAVRRHGPGGPAGAHRPADQAGLAGGAGLGDHGVRAAARIWRTSAAQRGVTTALDNTWGARPGLQRLRPGPGERRVAGSGADIVVQALTKYPSGGGDVLMGSHGHARRGAARAAQAHPHARWAGASAATMPKPCCARCPACALRYRAHDVAARGAGGLAAAPARRSRSCCIPAFEGSPGHEHWRALCGDDGLAAGLFSVVFDERYSPAPGRCLLRCAASCSSSAIPGAAR